VTPFALAVKAFFAAAVEDSPFSSRAFGAMVIRHYKSPVGLILDYFNSDIDVLTEICGSIFGGAEFPMRLELSDREGEVRLTRREARFAGV